MASPSMGFYAPPVYSPASSMSSSSIPPHMMPSRSPSSGYSPLLSSGQMSSDKSGQGMLERADQTYDQAAQKFQEKVQEAGPVKSAVMVAVPQPWMVSSIVDAAWGQNDMPGVPKEGYNSGSVSNRLSLFA